MNKKDLVLMALNDYGTTEIIGNQHNQKIISYFKKIGHALIKDDETGWCAAFLNAMLLKAGMPNTGKLNARSFLELGIETKEPELGDIVVLWRIKKDSPYGHVGLYIAQDETSVYILGGNQSNTVNISKYPKERVLSYRNLIVNI